MYIKGSRESVDKLKTYWDYDNMDDNSVYLKRTVDVSEEPHIFDENNNPIYCICGQVAWSVYDCWIKNDYLIVGLNGLTRLRDISENNRITTIDRLAKELNLYIEIMSDETGNGFMEHYYITPDGIQVEESIELDYDGIGEDEDKNEEIYERINDIIGEHHESIMYI
jgi:hypothetical protein